MQKLNNTNGTTKTERYFYAGFCGYGTDRMDFNRDYWTVYRFDSKAARDEWVERNEWSSWHNTWAARKITRKDAEKILGSFSTPSHCYYSVVLEEDEENRLYRRKEY